MTGNRAGLCQRLTRASLCPVQCCQGLGLSGDLSLAGLGGVLRFSTCGGNERNGTGQKEKSGCVSGAAVDLRTCPKLGPVYLEGWIFLPSPPCLIHQSLGTGLILDKVDLSSPGEKKGRQLRAVSTQDSPAAHGKLPSPEGVSAWHSTKSIPVRRTDYS